MFDFILWIVMIGFGAFLLVTPAEKLKQQFPKMPSTKAAKIIGGIILVVGIGILIIEVLMWLGKI